MRRIITVREYKRGNEMIEALWSLEFVAANGNDGGGVVIFESGRIFGGDSSYYYVGSYEISGSKLTANVVVNHYFGDVNNVFGPYKKVTLELAGQVEQDQFIVQGVAKEPASNAKVRLTRRSELP